jgi:hypothetical protein
MKLNKILVILSRVCLGLSIFFLFPALLGAEINPHNAIDVSATAYIFLIGCWLVNLLAQKMEK